MTTKIKHQDLCLPISPMFAMHLADLICDLQQLPSTSETPATQQSVVVFILWKLG
ncbi:hypothetical protein [Shewanella halifaxensis]|uniref:hypothetical protein n=1 Tax=Shewanella halifaxensis TaxID=271098 RepID=UPI0002E18B13|nr:hypothetical protein [Shewanella halifaxensis]